MKTRHVTSKIETFRRFKHERYGFIKALHTNFENVNSNHSLFKQVCIQCFDKAVSFMFKPSECFYFWSDVAGSL